MTQYNLEVIPEPAQGSAAVFMLSTEGPIPLLRGQGSHDFLCGACDNVIAKGVERGQVINIVLKCPNCGSFNRARGT
jgi:predicted RNA-binding Zn-ribbon protein involved in translation (DUF1610 family)